MSYVVTGTDATGVLGRSLAAQLAARPDGRVFVAAPEDDAPAIERLRVGAPEHRARIVHVPFDVDRPTGGVPSLPDDAAHVFNVAVGDAFVTGRDDVHEVVSRRTRAALDLAGAGRATFHHVASSVASIEGAGEPLQRAAAACRESEALVRTSGLASRLYRCGVVIGRADTGEADPDGPLSALFAAMRALGGAVPAWLPLPAPPLGSIDIAPADVIADALDALAHRDPGAARIFELPAERISVVDALNEVAGLAGAPRLAWPVDATSLAGLVPYERLGMLRFWPPTRDFVGLLLETLGFPRTLFALAATSAVRGHGDAGISRPDSVVGVPPFRSYAGRLWRWWEANRDASVHAPSLREAVEGKTALVTGSSTGIGRAVAVKLAEAGAHVLLVARSEDALREVADRVTTVGGRADVHPTDLSTTDAARALADEVLAAYGRVDVLVNNAGLSLNRPIAESVERIGDFERTMAVNYFGPVALLLGLLPSMRAHGAHVVNVLSGLVQAPAPGFAAYGASKAAFDNFAHVLRAELEDDGIAVTNVYMGLVHTAMSDPTEAFRRISALDPDTAADLVCDAIVHRPVVVSVEPLAALHGAMWAIWPTGAAALIRAVNRSMPWRREPSAPRG